jgi:hypothetical protein
MGVAKVLEDSSHSVSPLAANMPVLEDSSHSVSPLAANMPLPVISFSYAW